MQKPLPDAPPAAIAPRPRALPPWRLGRAARRRLVLFSLSLLGLAGGLPDLAATAAPAPSSSADSAPMEWVSLQDLRLEICGLPWFKANAPNLWRFPASAKGTVPKRVWSGAVAPDGGRIRLSCNTTRLTVKVQAIPQPRKHPHLDAFINGEYAGSVSVSGTQQLSLVFFEGKPRASNDITIYLPNTQQVRVFAVGVDPDAQFRTPPPFARKRPLVCYGSSVLQGTGATHPSSTYPAVLARKLNLDFVNLGFGGAGKGEPEVVSLVNQLDACAYLFDLGKSYGPPAPERFSNMLDTIRASHPGVPIFCVTPIYSLKEANEPAYVKRSEDLRTMMRKAASDRRQAGDNQMYVVEGLQLCGAADSKDFHDALHPNDQGNQRMAERLEPLVRRAVFGDEQSARNP